MKKLLLILLCLPIIGFGQSWQTNIGGNNDDFGTSVQQTTDGGYIMTGATGSFGNGYRAVYLVKTDGNGVEQWSNIFAYGQECYGYAVQQTTDGGYIISGVAGTSVGDVYLIKTDGNGVEQWSRTFGGAGDQYGYDVKQTTDGGYIITGSYGGSTGLADSSAVYLIKTDGNGFEQWNNGIGGTGVELGNSVQQTTDGGYIITGYTNSFGSGGWDIYLIKTDVNGVEQWSQTFGGAGYEEGHSVQQTTDGGYIITGYTNSFGSGGWDIYLIKTDVNGVEQWSQTFGGAGNEEGHSVQQTTDGGYIITGFTNSFGSGGMMSI